MTFKRRAIPEVMPRPPYEYQFFKQIREIVLELQVERQNLQGLTPLPSTATLADVIAKVNQVVEKLNG